MPLQVWILTATAFAIGTAEFVISGLLINVAHYFNVTEGTAGNLITAYALAIVFGGPLLTLWLARYDKKLVLIGLMILFIVANLVAALTNDFGVLLVSRVMAGLVQGPVYGLGSVIAMRLVSDKLAGRAVGRMFAGLTLANVLGVPGGSWIGNTFGWKMTFVVVAVLGVLALLAIIAAIPRQGVEKPLSVGGQLKVFGNWQLIASLLITVIPWVGFMTLYGYLAPVTEYVAHLDSYWVTWVLVIVGAGLVLGNSLGGRTADINLSKSLIWWPTGMVISLVLVGLVAGWSTWLFLIAAFIFGICSFSNVPPMQMRVMRNSAGASELAGTVNISAFNVANALGGVIGGIIVDSKFGAALVPYAGAIVTFLGLLFILSQELPHKTRTKKPVDS